MKRRTLSGIIMTATLGTAMCGCATSANRADYQRHTNHRVDVGEPSAEMSMAFGLNGLGDQGEARVAVDDD